MSPFKKGIIGITMIVAFGLSHATGAIYYTVNGGPTQQLHITPIVDTISGTIQLSSGSFCQVTCTLSTGIQMTDNLNGDTELAFTSGQMSGGGLCGALSLSGFPWVGSIPHASIPSPIIPVTFTIHNFAVSASICGSCSGQLNVTFDPADGGSFELEGPLPPSKNCSIMGASTSPNYYEVWH